MTLKNSPLGNLPKEAEQMQALGKALWLLAEEYKFSMEELSFLLDVKTRTLYNAKNENVLPSVSNDRILRVAHLLGIKKNLEILYPQNAEVRANWLRIERSAFKDRSALDLIKEGAYESMTRLFTVRRSLDMLRTGMIHELT